MACCNACAVRVCVGFGHSSPRFWSPSGASTRLAAGPLCRRRTRRQLPRALTLGISGLRSSDRISGELPRPTRSGPRPLHLRRCGSGGETGRRARLKIEWPRGHAGSSPAPSIPCINAAPRNAAERRSGRSMAGAPLDLVVGELTAFRFVYHLEATTLKREEMR